jgi:hypothetical protein
MASEQSPVTDTLRNFREIESLVENLKQKKQTYEVKIQHVPLQISIAELNDFVQTQTLNVSRLGGRFEDFIFAQLYYGKSLQDIENTVNLMVASGKEIAKQTKSTVLLQTAESFQRQLLRAKAKYAFSQLPFTFNDNPDFPVDC